MRKLFNKKEKSDNDVVNTQWVKIVIAAVVAFVLAYLSVLC